MNFRKIALTEEPTMEEVGVYLRNQQLTYLNWKGFIDVEAARSIPNARPVRLDVTAYVASDEIGSPRIDLKENEYCQGCVIGRGVYGVTYKRCPLVVRKQYLSS